MDYLERVTVVKQTLPAFSIPERAVRTVVYDFNGTLAENVQGETLEYYTRRLSEALEPLLALSDEQVAVRLEEKGIAVKGKNLSAKMREFVVESVRNPKRGTKAREVYYDLLESAMGKGLLVPRVLPDVLADGNSLDKEKLLGLSLVAFSRGTQSMLDKLLVLSGLKGKIDEIYSSIDFGGEKKAEAYVGLYKQMLLDHRIPTRFYDDEFDIVKEILFFRLAVQQSAPHFEVVWVDRKNEVGLRKEELSELEVAVKKIMPYAKLEDFMKIRSNLAD